MLTLVPAVAFVWILAQGATVAGAGAGPLFDITDRAATDLLERTPYIDAVLPGGAPGAR